MRGNDTGDRGKDIDGGFSLRNGSHERQTDRRTKRNGMGSDETGRNGHASLSVIADIHACICFGVFFLGVLSQRQDRTFSFPFHKLIHHHN